ncbi:hypothetical protein HJFPF1_10690 [Paramyrothecium foliicola]|nr:hypothetical protein HJFPF1_10690 [Paramyrothecium foliicola]
MWSRDGVEQFSARFLHEAGAATEIRATGLGPDHESDVDEEFPGSSDTLDRLCEAYDALHLQGSAVDPFQGAATQQDEQWPSNETYTYIDSPDIRAIKLFLSINLDITKELGDGYSCDEAKVHYEIVPAYTQNGLLFSRIFAGSVTATSFEDFIKQLLYYCARWPAPNSVLVMDDTPCHNRERTELLCAAAGVKLLLLPPDSADLNPIEGLMQSVGKQVEEHQEEYLSLAQGDHENFLGMCIEIVGSQQANARHHFQLAGLSVEEELK